VIEAMSHAATNHRRPGTPTSPLTAVLAGATCIGHVLACGRQGFRAFDADDQPLGTFPTLRDALGAISAASASTPAPEGGET
jgi:hypothetical protein